MVKVRGNWRLRVRESGVIVAELTGKNLVTQVGEEHIADQMADGGEAAMSHIAIGTGTGQTRSSTVLNTEVARVAFDTGYPQQGPTGQFNYVYYYATFGASVPSGDVIVTEFAVFNNAAAASGTMLNYISGFTAVTKEDAQTLEIESWIQFGGV